jgi:UrcA family protein
MNFTRIAVLVGGSLLGTLGVAQATTPANTVTLNDAVPMVVVRYGDLNLATETGARELYHRLSVAAQEVCPTQDTRSLALLDYTHTCRANAIARAVHQINSPQLAALHAGHSNRG